MGLAVIRSRALAGVDAPPVDVEVDIAGGLPAMTLVGLPEAAVKEAKDRVRAAVANAGYDFPLGRVTVNLAPADLPKEGGRFDLPIAVGLLAASGQLSEGAGRDHELLGELTLDGGLRAVRGTLAAALAAGAGERPLVVPADNAAEAAAGPRPVYGARSLAEVTAFLRGDAELAPAQPEHRDAEPPTDLLAVRGQHQARRALEVAAAGGHGLLFSGPPGTGKTLLARCLPGIQPPLTPEAQLAVARIRSVQGDPEVALDPVPPFRAPHHSASPAALVGGGSPPRPGEITRAHHGVLFLDELPEFDRRVLESLREPLESGRVTVARANRSETFPADFQLVAAMNPCPCGYQGDPRHACRCSPAQLNRYHSRLSGPLLDRMDLLVSVPALEATELRPDAPPDGEDSATVRARVAAARDRQLARDGVPAARLTASAVEQSCRPDDAGLRFLESAVQQLGLSARAYHRVLRVARTVADLAGEESVASGHIAEAVHFRRLAAQGMGG
jgi:magnesium chelatase family protein